MKYIIFHLSHVYISLLIKYQKKKDLSNSNGIRTHNQIVRKRTLNYLAKLAIWLSYVVSTYL